MNSDEFRSSQTNSITSPVSLPAANNGFEVLIFRTQKKKQRLPKGSLCLLVRETGLEPVHQRYTPLKRARLPIPPLPRTFDIIPQPNSFVNRFL